MTSAARSRRSSRSIRRDEQSVYDEITEYVATDSIREQYHHLLKAIAEAPSEPHEGVGVWVSGFFGSGKSSFAKNLGYALQNRTGRWAVSFADLFKNQLDERTRPATTASATCSTPSTPACPRMSFSSRSPRSGTPGRSRSGSPS